MTDRLDALAAWEPVLAAPGLVFGAWATAEPDESGVIQMPWYRYGPEAEQFEASMYALGWVHDFDWMAWSATADAQRLLHGPVLIGAADAEDLSRLLTTIIRGERFSEGEIAGAFEAGILTAITRRARVLAGQAMAREGGLPFVPYEGGGRKRLNKPAPGNLTARTGYGLPVFRQCGYVCVYCGLDMRATFENWLQLSVDHVIPRQMKDHGFEEALIEDITNLVTCCRACNDFGNRYLVAGDAPTSDDAFYDLRDRVFRHRKETILARREAERVAYERAMDDDRGSAPVDPICASRGSLRGDQEPLNSDDARRLSRHEEADAGSS